MQASFSGKSRQAKTTSCISTLTLEKTELTSNGWKELSLTFPTMSLTETLRRDLAILWHFSGKLLFLCTLLVTECICSMMTVHVQFQSLEEIYCTQLT